LPAAVYDWHAAGKPAELHIFHRGGHGFGMNKRKGPSDVWIDLFYAWMESSGFLKAGGRTVGRLYVFGDSYSDTGAGYLDGNGPTAVAYLAERLGFKLALPKDAGADSRGINFAVSGAKTGRGGGIKVKDALLGRGMADQVDDFVSRVQAKTVTFDADGTLFFLAGGLNDGSLASEVTVSNLKEEVRKLYGAGARRFRIALLPTSIPGFSAVGQRLNPELSKIPGALQAELPGAEILLSRWGMYFDEVMKNPSAYGIENTKDACAGRALFGQDATPCAKPAAYYYYHSEHPSTAVHKIAGKKLYAEITAAP